MRAGPTSAFIRFAGPCFVPRGPDPSCGVLIGPAGPDLSCGALICPAGPDSSCET